MDGDQRFKAPASWYVSFELGLVNDVQDMGGQSLVALPDHESRGLVRAKCNLLL